MTFGLRELCTEFEDRRMNCKMYFLKINGLLEFRRLVSNLFHSMIVDGKKEFLKKLCFVFKKGKVETFLVVHNECLTEIKLKRYCGF